MDKHNQYSKPVAFYGFFTEQEAASIREQLDSFLPHPIANNESEESFNARLEATKDKAAALVKKLRGF